MTREQGPKFSEKHGADTEMNPVVQQKVEDKSKDNEISCAVAFQIAAEVRATPTDVGKGIDLLDIRLVKCQLGLFGYGPGKKAVKPKPPQSPDLEEAIRTALAEKKIIMPRCLGHSAPVQRTENGCQRSLRSPQH